MLARRSAAPVSTGASARARAADAALLPLPQVPTSAATRRRGALYAGVTKALPLLSKPLPLLTKPLPLLTKPLRVRRRAAEELYMQVLIR